MRHAHSRALSRACGRRLGQRAPQGPLSGLTRGGQKLRDVLSFGPQAAGSLQPRAGTTEKQLTAEARQMFTASERAEAARRGNETCKRWWPRAGGAVQTLMHNFPLALALHGFPA